MNKPTSHPPIAVDVITFYSPPMPVTAQSPCGVAMVSEWPQLVQALFLGSMERYEGDTRRDVLTDIYAGWWRSPASAVERAHAM